MKRTAYSIAALSAGAIIAWMGMNFGFSGYDVSAAISPRSIYFGEAAVYKITAVSGSGVTVAVQSNIKDLMPAATILKEGASERSLLWRKRREVWWSFSVDGIGDYSIPPVRVVFTGPSGDKSEMKTTAALVVVKSMTGVNPFSTGKVSVEGEGSYRGAGRSESSMGGSVDGPIRIRIEDRRLPLDIFDRNKALIAAGASAAIAAVVYIGIYLWRKRPRKARYVPPEEAFRADIESLAGELSGGKCDAREFYYRLSRSARAYLKHRVGLSGRELTTKELVGIIEASAAMDAPVKAYCSELLTACDRVKYAGASVYDADGIARHMNIAREILKSDPKNIGAEAGSA